MMFPGWISQSSPQLNVCNEHFPRNYAPWLDWHRCHGPQHVRPFDRRGLPNDDLLPHPIEGSRFAGKRGPPGPIPLGLSLKQPTSSARSLVFRPTSRKYCWGQPAPWLVARRAISWSISPPANLRWLWKLPKRQPQKQVEAVDAPVSGGDVGAREARLSIMIGGNQAAVDSLEPIFQTVGAKWVRQGGPGAGQHTKMVNQTLIASNMVAVCEGLLYAYRAGLDLETVMESVSSGAAGSWSLANLGSRMIAGNYDPGFFVEHFIKDMGIALEEARRMGISLPGLALAEQLYIALASQGHRRSGTQALILALAKLSDVDWEKRA